MLDTGVGRVNILPAHDLVILGHHCLTSDPGMPDGFPTQLGLVHLSSY